MRNTLQPHLFEHCLDARLTYAIASGQALQVVERSSAGMCGARVKHGTYFMHRPVNLVISAIADQRLARGRVVQADEYSQCR
ncbi:hypothetical protein GCM10010201_33790 [Pilimelia columellifera subsp. columellifera]|uniref:Uncharacterized protein n=1 Tax=Pilimelia columellifera subsp. columellifera TaxID=706583 RepID=A0ABN3NRV4_9ACTN